MLQLLLPLSSPKFYVPNAIISELKFYVLKSRKKRKIQFSQFWMLFLLLCEGPTYQFTHLKTKNTCSIRAGWLLIQYWWCRSLLSLHLFSPVYFLLFIVNCWWFRVCVWAIHNDRRCLLLCLRMGMKYWRIQTIECDYKLRTFGPRNLW